MDMSNFRPLDTREFANAHSKTLYRSICVPSVVQSYSLCVEYMKNWFLSKFQKDTFKSIYTEGKNIYDDFRPLSKIELIKRQKPSLAIVPSFSWDFDNEGLSRYPYGLSLYTQSGKFKESFFNSPETKSYMGLGMETILMQFIFRIRLETRAQQLDMYKYIKLAHRVGFTCGEDVDLDFHLPYELMIQMANDNGFEVECKTMPNGEEIHTIKKVTEFLRWLNMHSSLPFLYKYRALNGNNEFFLRMKNMYVHVRPTDLSADDGEREGQMSNNFNIELTAETRFPAPKMYAYYSDNTHHLTTVYGAWWQPNGPITTTYTFKGTDIPDENKYGWPLYMNTTYEDEDSQNKILKIDMKDLLEGDIGECIKDCMSKGISPSIFCDMLMFNGSDYIDGDFDWNTMIFTSKYQVRYIATYIAIYIDKEFINDFIIRTNNSNDSRIDTSKKQYHSNEYHKDHK